MRIVLRFRAPRGVPGGYVGASLAAHAVFAAALVLVPLLRSSPPLIPVDVNVVELAGPLPAPSRGGSSAVAAPAPPKPAPKVVEKAAEKAPAPEKLVLAKPSKKKEPDRKKRPEPAEGGDAPPSAAPAPAPAPEGAGTGVTALEGGGIPGAGWYNAAVTSALQGAWVKPVLDASDQVYSVVVAFEIGRDGNVFNLAVDVPSGVAALDRSALRAVTDAAPFPAPPASAGGSIRQRIRFELSPE